MSSRRLWERGRPVCDERADENQRDALLNILNGGEADAMTTRWWVFSAMCPNKLEPLFLPIDVAIDVEARRGHIRVPGIIETVGEPIRCRWQSPYGREDPCLS